MTRRPIVTDHAVLRYLERAHGLDVEFFRDRIATLTATGVDKGATGVKVEGVNFILQGEVVVTVLKRHWHSRDRRSALEAGEMENRTAGRAAGRKTSGRSFV